MHGSRALIGGGGCIFIYSGPAQLIILKLGSCSRCPNRAGAAGGQQVVIFDKNLYLLFIQAIKLTSVFKQSSSHLHLKLL